jgi:putative FmdB family regulatory protein
MPIYEYRCNNCGRKTSLFRQSIAEASAAENELKCERCGSDAVRRIFSRFAVGRGATDKGEEIYQFDRLTAGLDADDPADVSRWAESIGGEPD